MKKFLKWTFAAVCVLVVAAVAKNLYDQVTIPIPEADQLAADEALMAAEEALDGSGITINALLYNTSDERVGVAFPDREEIHVLAETSAAAA
jgi:hypothetical protein